MADKLTPEQEIAVRDRGGKLLVSAAAGSGKTKVLVDRLLSYILDPNHPANVDDFLIITYTKAAASELRGKISAKLTEKIAEQPENFHLQQQVQRLYLAKISTVHSFCSDILRENAYRMDLPADFRVADETESFEMQWDVLENLLEDAYGLMEEHPEFCDFIDTQGFGRDDRQIPDIILKVYKSAKCHLNPDGWLEWCLQSVNTDNLHDAGQTVWGKYLMERFMNYLDLQIEAMETAAIQASENGTMPKPAALLFHTVEQLRSLRSCNTWDAVCNYPKIDYGRLVFPKSCTDESLADRIKAVRAACKKGIENRLRNFSESSDQILSDLDIAKSATKGLVYLVRSFNERYAKLKLRRRILDFSDLEHKTLDLFLGKRRSGITAAARETGQRFREIMVDEYQDSNAVQDAIFAALTESRQNCFMVGDVKQSIYQFRLADPGIFIEKYNAYRPAGKASPGEGRKVLLGKNFRSSDGIISAVNNVFSCCMSKQVGGLDYGPDEMLYEGIPHCALPDPEVELYGVDVREDTYAEEASFAAERISQLLSEKKLVRDGDTLRPVRPEDIVILLRSPGSVGGEFRMALEQRGIPCSTGDSTDLLQAEEIGVLRALLQIIDNPLQDIPFLAVLASPVFEFTADDLAAIRFKDKKCSIYEALKQADFPKTAAFLECLDLLRQDARVDTVTELLEHINGRTSFLSIYSAMDDGEVRRTNLHAFQQIASDYETGGRKDLYHFLQFLDTAEEKGLTVSSEQSSAGCVTIMSIHKSKGLEFPVVLLCGLSRSFNRESTRAQVLCHKDLGLGLCSVDNEKRVRYPTIAKRAIAARMTEESISEEMRVLYVAMTRARDRLIMTYAASNLSSSLSDIVQRLDLCGKELLTGDVSCPGAWVLQTALRRTEAGAFFAEAGYPSSTSFQEPAWHIDIVQSAEQISAEVEVQENTEQLSQNQLEFLRNSLQFQYPYEGATRIPSKLTATQLKGRQKDLESAENTLQTMPGTFRKPVLHRKRESGKNYGTAMHAVMQYISYDQCRDVDGVQKEIQRLLHENLISQEQAEMADSQAIALFFASDLGRQIQQGREVLREFKFSILSDAEQYFPDVTGEQVLLQGVVDCALVENDGITVIDFKTDYVDTNCFNSLIERYGPQVKAYADALSRIFALPVKKSFLYFFHIGQFTEIG